MWEELTISSNKLKFWNICCWCSCVMFHPDDFEDWVYAVKLSNSPIEAL